MWQVFAWLSWLLTAVIFAWLIWDFFRVNMGYSEQALLSSREGVDELFAAEAEKH
jgi:hypothetical protein